MFSLTVYQNNDSTQSKTFQARTKDALLAKLETWLDRTQPDVCVGFDADGEPKFVLNYCESTRDWEWRESLNDIDVLDDGEFAAMKPNFIQQAQFNINYQG